MPPQVSQPTISAIVPTFNREALVGDAIDSILAQEYPGLEVIVVDDGSTDATAERLSSYGAQIRAIHQDNAGPAAARNHGLRMARGELIAFLDSDDLWPADKLARQSSYLEAHPEVDVVLGYAEIQRAKTGPQGLPSFEVHESSRRIFQIGCALYRRSVFERVGLFDASMRYWEDEDWFARARSHGARMVCLKETTLIMRFHGGNMTNNMKAADPDLLRFLKSHRDRQREAAPAKTATP